jgi:hypothetical protein
VIYYLNIFNPNYDIHADVFKEYFEVLLNSKTKLEKTLKRLFKALL